jgi:tRNA (guanine37-N1)-methyltransferase
MKIGIISLFPEMFAALNYGIPRRAQEKGILSIACWNPRDFTSDVHRTVDDSPYGGGPGMVMKAEPLQNAINAARKALSEAKVIYLSPQGKTLDHQAVKEFSEREEIIFLCGRYEGIDERIVQHEVDAQWSIGDYVLSGGELPAMVFIDAIIRQLPDVLGDETSAEEDSFVNGMLDYPHYTRPAEFAGENVPSVLLSGDHAAIKTWRLKQALGLTYLRRPDLLKKKALSHVEQTLLDEFIKENVDVSSGI